MAQVSKPKNLFLVPYWIVNHLQRHQLPLSTLGDLPKLREIASSEDLALTLLLNQRTDAIFGANVPLLGLAQHWVKSPEAANIYAQLMELAPIHANGLQERLFSEDNFDPRYPKEFDIQDIDDDTFLIIIYPGHFGGADAYRHQTKLIRAYLAQWYGYSNFDAVAQDPLFRQYLARL